MSLNRSQINTKTTFPPARRKVTHQSRKTSRDRIRAIKMSEAGEEMPDTGEHMSEQDLLESLRLEISKTQFCCSGRIPISTKLKAVNRYGSWKNEEYFLASPPVTIRWENQKGRMAKITLPTECDDSPKVAKLRRDSQNASFGPEYESASADELKKMVGHLDTSQFSTTFNPYDFGIVDVIKKVLLSGVGENCAGIDGLVGDGDQETWGVVAELCNLEVRKLLFSSREETDVGQFYSEDSKPTAGPNTQQIGFQTQNNEPHESHGAQIQESTEFGTLIVSLPSLNQGRRYFMEFSHMHSCC